jgi:SNF2 family DNA or RNA helicase
MGDGKTRVACEIIKAFREKDDVCSYILIIAPASTIKETWKTHLKDYFGTYSSAMGDGRKKYFNHDETELIFRPNQIVITSYQTAVNDCELYLRTPPALIVYDEIQYLNNSKKQLTACQILAKLNEKVDYKLGLSGTPSQNSVNEFVITYCFFNDCDNLQKYFKVYRKKHQEKRKLIVLIRDRIIKGNFYFFSTFSGFSGNSFMGILPVEIDKEMYDNYLQLENHNEENNNLQQFINQYLLYPNVLEDSRYKRLECLKINPNVPSNKIEMLKSIMKHIPPNDKIIVFSYYKKPLHKLLSELNEYNPVIITGKNEKDKGKINIDIQSVSMDKQIKIFNEKDDCRVMLTTLKMSSTGLNLQKANHLFILDLWWNPMIILQAIARIRRLGQKKPIFCYLLAYSKPKKNQPDDSNPVLIENDVHYLEVMRRKINEYNKMLSDMGMASHQKQLPVMEDSFTLSDSDEDLLRFLKGKGFMSLQNNDNNMRNGSDNLESEFNDFCERLLCIKAFSLFIKSD